MSQFRPFGQAVHRLYTALAAHELYTVALTGDELYAAYLAAFPEGTNPLYKTRTEHDCSCCRNFIRNLGPLVAIIDGEKHSVWAVDDVDYPYNVVAKVLDELVRNSPITGIFRTAEHKYGAEYNIQQLEDKTTIRWNHFAGDIQPHHHHVQPASAIGLVNGSHDVFKRALEELTTDAFEQVLELIETNSLYRGEEHKEAVKAYYNFHVGYQVCSTDEDREVFRWKHATNPAVRFRNTVIGTLVDDLSKGIALEDAVKMFESKVAPANYKRPTALITPRMIEAAMHTIYEAGLEPALHRRHATLADVTVNNVLWADTEAKRKMKGGVADLLMAAVVQPEYKGKPEDIGIEEFMQKVLPQAVSMSVLVKNAQQSNFMSVTAPVHADSANLFKWGNNFAWSYDGNVADSLRQRVAAAGGRVDGVLRFSHSWNYSPEMRNASLMDLHVFCPGSSPHKEGTHDNYPSDPRVGWNHRQEGSNGGVQDVDYTAAAPVDYVPVENITFPKMSLLREGEYVFKIHNWSLRTPTLGGFKAEIELNGQVFEYEYRKPLGQKEWVTVAKATLKGGVFTIEHMLPHRASSQTKWGVKTEAFTKVNTVMYSPNHWDGESTGNKHVFFILDGCVSDSPTRGVYNEFLHQGLQQHSKVFEALGNKLLCPPATEQLSGVGFSSTRGDEVVVQVSTAKSRRDYNIKF